MNAIVTNVPTVLLAFHVAAGFTALLAALVAVLSRALPLSHRWHVVAGSAFTLGMLGVFLSAIPLALLRGSVALLMIGVFSGYLALGGWRRARNRAGQPAPIDWVAASLMLAVSAGMLGYGGWLLIHANGNGVTLMVFGAIGALLAVADLRQLRAGGWRGTKRIAGHLTMMLAGAIAASTAFIVTNFKFTPGVLLWLAPTALITPLIVYWRRRVEAQPRTAAPHADPRARDKSRSTVGPHY